MYKLHFINGRSLIIDLHLNGKTIVIVGAGNEALKRIKLLENEKCQIISKGHSTFFEPELEKTLRKGLKNDLIKSNDISLIKQCDFIFVTVGTPQKANGAIELSMIKNSVSKIGIILHNNKKDQIILIKSTV